jgi:hypothetical protein
MVDSLEDQNKVAFMTCIEIVIMRSGANYHLIAAKLNALYNCALVDCYENPEYLRTVLKEVYKEDYNSIIQKIKLELDYLVDMEERKAHFFKVMES